MAKKSSSRNGWTAKNSNTHSVVDGEASANKIDAERMMLQAGVFLTNG